MRIVDFIPSVRLACLTRRRAVAHAAAAYTAGAMLALALAELPAAAQDFVPPPPPGVPAGAPPSGPVQYAPGQLDQMLAPIALYPDDLLAQILMAATYPLEVVQADRWLQDPQNGALRGDSLAQALQTMPWDASVKSLAAYPQILSMMDANLDWTEALGEVFLAQQAQVMDSVQRLRSRAQAAGRLSSNAEQTVTGSGQGIDIASAAPGVEYVPVYDPQVMYGDWPYPDYPPDFFYIPGYDVGTFIAYPILAPYWGWDRWDWRHHRIDIDAHPGVASGGVTAQAPMPWRHDPSHRHGVPYADPRSQARYENPAATVRLRENYRGYPAGNASGSTGGLQLPEARTMAPPSTAVHPQPVPQMPHPIARPAPQVPPAVSHPMPEIREVAPMERPSAPAFESFGHGESVRAQETRGATSREGSGGARGGRIR